MEALLSEGDPNTLFELIEELAVGSYGTVYKVWPNSSVKRSVTLGHSWTER